MLGHQNLIAFLATRDAGRCVAFYVDVLGLRKVSEDDYAVVLDAHGTTLRVQKVEALDPAPYTALGWAVADVRHVVEALAAKGVRCERYPWLPQDEDGIWSPGGGVQVAWFKDPDGHTLSLTQFQEGSA